MLTRTIINNITINKGKIMTNRLKMLIITLMAVAMPLGVVTGVTTVGVSTVSAQDVKIADNLCSGAELKYQSTGSTTCANDPTNTNRVNSLVTTIINIFSWVIGVVAVIMIIYAGFKYIISGGESGGVKAAKDTILYAIIGLVVVLLAQTIVKFVLGAV